MLKLLLLLMMLQPARFVPLSSMLTPRQQHVISCARAIMTRHFIPGRVTLVSAPNIPHDVHIHLSLTPSHWCDHYLMDVMLATLNTEQMWPLTLFRPQDSITRPSFSNNFGKHLWIEQHIIIVWVVKNKTDEHFRLIYDTKYTINTVMHTSRFVVIVFHEGAENIEICRLMFSEIVSTHMYNVQLVIPNSGEEIDGFEAIDLFTWFPYQPAKQCGKFKEVTRLDQWIEEDEGRFMNGVDLYPNKAPKNFQRCPIKLSNYQFKNRISRLLEPVEGKVVKFIFSSLNLRISVARVPDIIFGGVTLNFFGKIDKNSITFPHLFTTLKWYVPCAKHIPRQGNFTKVFSWSLWLATASVSLLAVAAIFWIYKSYREPRSVAECFLEVSAVVLGVSVSQVPRACGLRAFFLIWVCYSLAISTVFQSFFTSYLVDPGLQDQISTLEEMLQSGIKYGIPPTEELFWCNMTEFNRRTCDQVTILQKNKLLYYNDFIGRDDTALLAHDVEMDVVLSCLKKPRACSFSDGCIEVMFAIYFPNGIKSILYEPFNTVVIRMFEAGITEKLKDDSFMELRSSLHNSYFAKTLKEEMRRTNFSFKNSTYSDDIDGDGYFVFSVSHLQMAFYILAFGKVVSFVIFIAEIIYNKV